jgi:hypothetical protein
MAKSRKRTNRTERNKHQQHGPRRSGSSGSLPLLDRAPWARPGFEAGAEQHYDLTVSVRNPRTGTYKAETNIEVPVYRERYRVRVEIHGTTTRVFVDDFPGPLRHQYPDGSLCMWHPDDPEDRRWTPRSCLLKLLDTVSVHLFRERYYQEHPDEGWPGDEVPHPSNKPKALSLDW